MFFIDIQGTLIDDVEKKPISGAIELINYLNNNSIPFIAVTNNTKQESEKFLEYLNSIGLNISKEKYLDPLMVLQEKLLSKKIFAFGHEKFLEILKSRGFETSSNNPDSIVLGVKEDYTHLEYAKIIELLLENRPQLVGMHGTSIYAKNGKRFPGVGAILEMMKFATNSEYSVLGKPSVDFYKKALQILGADDFKKVTMISDDLKGDLKGAKQLGMKTVFVLSGKFKSLEELEPLNEFETPDTVLKNVGEFKF
jgi:NagD protein